ncbi:MAG: copper homeostasis protein CutC [Faecousia sp.]
MTDPILFEACCGSTADALAAWKGGANRVELNSDMFHGGLTPTLGSLLTVKKHAPDLKVMCMVRPREGGFCYTDVEFETMLADARIFLDNGADGIVFGFLHEDATVDTDRVKAMLEVIGDHESVFHRAIDVVPDVMTALDQLIELGVTRVLTSGQKPTVPEGIFTIKAMIEHAAGRIQILPGCGITPENAQWVRQMTGTTMMHAALTRTVYDRSAMGNPSIYFGGCVYPPEDRYSVTAAEDIANFVASANR